MRPLIAIAVTTFAFAAPAAADVVQERQAALCILAIDHKRTLVLGGMAPDRFQTPEYLAELTEASGWWQGRLAQLIPDPEAAADRVRRTANGVTRRTLQSPIFYDAAIADCRDERAEIEAAAIVREEAS